MPATELSVRIDLTTLSPVDLPNSVAAELEGLAPGALMTLTGTQEQLRAALAGLRGLAAGRFEWTPLPPATDGTTLVEIARRDAAAGSPREILESLAWDHDRLDALEQLAFSHVASGNSALATEVFSKFAFGLDRHIRFEEELLFPAFEDAACIPAHAGPTAVMRSEHIEIRSLLRLIGEAIPRGSSPDLDRMRSRFHDVLGVHNEKEEQMLYPMTDRMLGPDADTLMAKIQSME